MKKIFFVAGLLFYCFCVKAEIHSNPDTLKTDSAKINKQATKFQLKLVELKAQLTDAQNKLPIDSATLSTMLVQSHEAQVKSKKRSEDAVGGSLSDAKQAEKQAKEATKQTQKADDEAKQVDHDRKKIKDLTKEIEKKQKQLNALQGQ